MGVSIKQVLKEYEEIKLAHWVKTQKENYKKGILTDEQIKKLESLPNWSWD